MTNPMIDTSIVDRLNKIPDFVNRYELIEFISSNNMTETFLVRSRVNGQYLVTKVYPKALDSGNENIIIKHIDYPLIPKPVENIESEDLFCIIREYVEGYSLDKLDLPLSEEKTLDIALQLCDILSYLHSKTPAIIHRDIKPQNVILDDNGLVHLIDFGISRYYTESTSKDTTHVVTDGFAPPEQYGFIQTDNRADIYSLGVLLCFLLTGDNDLNTLDIISNKQLVKVIRKCTEFAPKDRYSSVEAVKKALLYSRKKRISRSWIAVAIITPLIIICAFIIHGLMTSVTVPEPVVFQEPLIEQAVRVSLGIDDDTVITEETLLYVKALYISSFHVFDSSGEFLDYIDRGHTPGQKGHVRTLEDLVLISNLEELYINNQQITNIEPLRGLTNLKILFFNELPVDDISPLENLILLEDIHLNFMLFTDISPLTKLPNLHTLQVWECPNVDVREYVNFRNLRHFTTILSGYEPVDYRYLPNSPLEGLNIDSSAIDSLKWLDAYKPTLNSLFLSGTGLTNLDGIEEFINLDMLGINRMYISDLSPLLLLPNLRDL